MLMLAQTVFRPFAGLGKIRGEAGAMPVKKNHYNTLGIPQDADEREIRAAYRNLAKKYHPDAGEGSSADIFRAVQEAYDLLSDENKRRDYDNSRARGLSVPVRKASPASPSSHLDLRDLLLQRSRPIEDRKNEIDPIDALIEHFFGRF
jgi:curved DNA-binding protein CbpA